MSLFTNHNENDFLGIFVASDSVEVYWVELHVQSFLWTSFEMSGELTLTHLKVAANQASLIHQNHIGYLVQELNCPYGQWDACFFNIFIVSKTFHISKDQLINFDSNFSNQRKTKPNGLNGSKHGSSRFHLVKSPHFPPKMPT